MFSKLKIFIEAVRVSRSIKKSGGIRICSEAQAQDFVAFIGYRAQLALYELHTDLKADMSWDDFILLVRGDAALRKKTQRIVYYAISHFDVKLLDFEIPVDALAYREDDPDDPQVESSQIFSDKAGRDIIVLLFTIFEAEHFNRLEAVTPHYTWKAYVNDLSNNKELWGKFSRGFQNGLRQLDFKASWTANATRDELLRLEFQEGEA